MDKTYNCQLELFNDSGLALETKNNASINPLAKFLRNYEKKALLVVGILIISIISFSLGVERGKRIPLLNNAAPRINSTVTLAQQKTPINSTVKSALTKKLPLPAEPVVLTAETNYIIQLASYKGKASAQKEASNLKTKGITPIILSKGNYLVLCVGGFKDKKTAQASLLEFKKTYRDCCIKKTAPKSTGRKQM